MHVNIGTHIARLRREQNMKQDDLAEKLDVTPQAISKWENGASMPDISLLPKIAETEIDVLESVSPPPTGNVSIA